MKYKGIIFDLDGVICSTDHYHYLAWKALADRLGAYFDETINNRLRGVSRMASLEIVLERYNGTLTEEEKLAAAEEKNNTYRELLKQMTPADLSDEVKTTLDALRAKGLLLGIGSSSKNTRFILSRIGLGDYFDKISDGTNITRSKPDPEVFLKAAEYLGLEPKDWTPPPWATPRAADLPNTVSGAFPSCWTAWTEGGDTWNRNLPTPPGK